MQGAPVLIVAGAFVSLAAQAFLCYAQGPVTGKPAAPLAPEPSPIEQTLAALKPAKDMDASDWLATDIRAVDRAAVEPAFMELVVTDPKLAAVVLSTLMRLPLDVSDKEKARLRDMYDMLPPPLPPGVSFPGGSNWVPEPAAPPRPTGCFGTRVRLQKPDDPLQQQIGALLAKSPAPPARAAHYQKAWKKLNFLGWNVTVVEAKIVNNATTVLATARPLAETVPGGSGAFMESVIETYELKDGKLKLLKIKTRGPEPTGEEGTYSPY